MRDILPACPACRHLRRHGMTAGPDAPPCGRCGGFGVLMDTTIHPTDRQIIDAWRDEPAWHRAKRWRAEAEGRPGFFQKRGATDAELVVAPG